ncbi:Sugar transporter STL1 [Penicillium subrubescens]|uniref:Sugar transporter STL1 n=1 Tax=Penicillium subrubescens TaxID=1316194 RepID=A0A1Q5UN03_9EURO|nr:Sugar transporter STL1 [Penicillium subrubescens]
MAIMFTCQLAFILFVPYHIEGYDQGVFSGIVGNDDFLEVIHHPSAGILGIIVSIYNLGCFTGTIVSFVTGDRLGPRRSMWFAMVWIIIGATLQTTAFSRAQLLVARFVTGIGTGIETTTVPVYQSELCEARKRGKYVSSEPLFVGVGIVIAYWFDYGMSLPESPRWLYRHNRPYEALQVLCDVYNMQPDDPKVVSESEGILEAIELETLHGEYKWSQILKRDEVQTGKRVLLAYGIQFMNQMGGINLVVYYVTSVLQYNVGLDRKLSLLLGGVIQIMFVIGTSIEKPTASASVAFFFLFMLIFGASVNCIPWVYGPEILPLHVRAKGQAIGISANWLWNFFVVMITPTLIENLAWKGYLIFMCLNLAFVPIVYFFYPETANLTLEEIDFLFTDRARHPSLRAHINASGDNGAGGNGGGVAAGKESESTSPVEVREDHVKEENYN